MSYLDFLKAIKPYSNPLPRTSKGLIESSLNADGAANMKPNPDTMDDNGSLIYPQNLFQPGNEAYVFFVMRDSNKRDAAPLKRIGMYMPPAIKVKYHTQWETINMSLQQAGSAAQDAWNAFTKNFGTEESSRGISSMAYAGVKGATNLLDDAIGGGTFGQQADVIAGRTVDPHQALMFKGVDFRTFSFEFQMLARSKTESDSIRQIIKTFKWGMHPGKEAGALWWLYPSVFDIYLLTPSHEYMFNIMQCVLEDMDVDYGGSGAASFFKTTGAPVDIRMTLNFKELSLLTKEQILQDY